MLTFNGVLKAVPIDQFRTLVDVNKDEHIFCLTNSGCLLYTRVKDGLCKMVISSISSNSYGTLMYSHTANCAYFVLETSTILTELDLDTLVVSYYDFAKYINNYVNVFTQSGVNITTNLVQSAPLSTDGNIYFMTIRYLGISNVVKFDVTTKEFSTQNLYADKEAEHIYGKGYLSSVNINSGPVGLRGYYTEYLFDDSQIDLYSTILTELTSSGLSHNFQQNFSIYLHYSDRAVGSTTRRVIIRAPTWKIIDLKSTSVYIDSGDSSVFNGMPGLLSSLTTWQDQTTANVDETSWQVSTISGHAASIGITMPTFNPNIHYGRARHVGRFTYHWGNYMANGTIYNHFAFDPDTGAAMYPESFDKYTAFLNNGNNARVCWANMPSLQGFSGSPEYVAFVNSSLGWGYYRPDTKAFTLYDPTTNPSGYVIAELTLDNPYEQYGLGCRLQEYPFDENRIDFNGEDWIQANHSNCAVNPDPRAIIDPVYSFAELLIEYTPDSSKGLVAVSKFNGVTTLTGTINSAYQIGSKYIFGGHAYAGISVGEVPVSTYIQDAYYGEIVSIYGSVRWGSLVVFYGYLNDLEVIDGTAKTKASVGGFVNQQNCAAPRLNELIVSGTQTRVANYRDDYFAVCYIDSIYQSYPFINLPDIISVQNTVELRNATGMPLESYSDSDVNSKLVAYQTANGLTRTQAINLFLGTTPYRAQDVVAYDDFVVINCKHLGISGLSGIRINTANDMSGTWVGSDYNNATRVPTIVRFEKSDLSTLSGSDYKVISLNISGFTGSDGVGRMYQTDNYICWFYKSGTNLEFRAISKTNLEAATTQITAWDKTVTIALGTSAGGWGNYTGFFSETDRFLNFVFAEGDNIYASLIGSIASGGDWVIALKIDVVAQTSAPFIKSSDRTTITTMTYNPDTDDCMISRDTGAKMFENISVASLPLTY